MERNKKIILALSLLVLGTLGGYLIYRTLRKPQGEVTAETKKNKLTLTRA
jgi:hypothetical protein